MNYPFPLLLLFLTFGWTLSDQADVGQATGSDHFSLTIREPHVVSDREDALVCTGRKLDPQESHLVKFIPHASKGTAHHLMVYGCRQPGSHNSSWSCHMEDNSGVGNSVCEEGTRQILFAWALDAPSKSLPKGVGLRVSGDTGIDYIVVQLHYAKEFPPGVYDNSGVTLEMTNKRPPMQAGYIVAGNMGLIPPQQKEFHLESSCVYERDYTIYPIGYRTHAHNLGVVTSGYRIRDNIWTEIGRMSPQLPETFYEVTHPGMDIRPGDKIASRCAMNSMARNETTFIGPTNHDEMCNFYIMYATYHQENLVTSYCFKESTQYQWSDEFTDEEIPKTASSLDGIDGAEEVKEMFHLKSQDYRR